MVTGKKLAHNCHMLIPAWCWTGKNRVLHAGDYHPGRLATFMAHAAAAATCAVAVIGFLDPGWCRAFDANMQCLCLLVIGAAD